MVKLFYEYSCGKSQWKHICSIVIVHWWLHVHVFLKALSPQQTEQKPLEPILKNPFN